MTDTTRPEPLRRLHPDEGGPEHDAPFGASSALGSGSTQRLKPIETVTNTPLNKDDIANKSGNVLFSFGNPGSGKTTFQWFLMRYLLDHGDFSTEVELPQTEQGPNWDGRRLLNEWKQQWITGTFPDSTSSSEKDIREMTVNVTPMEGETTSCRFSFLEVSGELLRHVDPSHNANPKLADTLEAYLENPKIKLTFVLLLHPGEELNDNLFASFMMYLKEQYPNIRHRTSLAVVVSDPKASFERLRTYGDARQNRSYHEWDSNALEAYVDNFASEAYQAIRSWPNQDRAMMCSLNLGEIGAQGGEPVLITPDFDDISDIFDWLYTQFTGKTLGPTRWQRFVGSLLGHHVRSGR